MLAQALDFQAESDELLALLESLDDADWQRETQFKHWMINDIIAHLHFFNYAADTGLRDSDEFANLMRQLSAAARQGTSHLSFTHAWLGVRNRNLMQKWRDFYREMA